MFTDKQLVKLKPGMHADGGGLYIRVSPKGKKSWVRRCQSDGRDTWKTIGVYPRMSMAEARRIGLDSVSVLSVQELQSLYLSKLSVRRLEQVQWLLKDLPDNLSIQKREVVALLQTKAATAPVMANRMLSRWKDFYEFCCQQGYLSQNPLNGVMRKFVGGKENSRDCVLEWTEIVPLLGTNVPILGYILLTGLRPSEAIYSLRNARTTKIPTKRSDYQHSLPKSHLIRWYIRQFQHAAPKSHLVVSNRLRRNEATFRPHDLRRTFATRISDLGVEPYVVEKLLGHKMPGVMAVYNHAEYWPERIAAQRKWDKALIALWRKEQKKTPAGAGVQD